MEKRTIIIILCILSIFLSSCTKQDPIQREYGKISWKDKRDKAAKIFEITGNVKDYQTIQEAIDDTFAKGGGTLYFPPGSYTVREAITIRSEKNLPITLVGEAASMPVIKGDTRLSGPVITIESENVRIISLSIQAFSKEGSSLAIYGDNTSLYKSSIQGKNSANEDPSLLIGASKVFVSSCSFSHDRPLSYCIEIRKEKTKEVSDIDIVDFFLNGPFNGILISSNDKESCPKNILLDRGVFLNYSQDQLSVEGVKGLIVSNNMLDQSAQYCIRLSPKNHSIEDVEIYGNYIAASYGLGQNPRSTGILVESPFDHVLKAISISNNMIAYSVRGIAVETDKLSNSKVLDNLFQSTREICLYIEKANNISVERNSFKADPYSQTIEIKAKDTVSVIKNNF